LKNPIKKKAGEVAQGVGPKFKSQYRKKKKTKTPNTSCLSSAVDTILTLSASKKPGLTPSWKICPVDPIPLPHHTQHRLSNFTSRSLGW
jgi:hypothetical protein